MTSLTPLPAARLTSETLLGVLQKPHFRWRKSPGLQPCRNTRETSMSKHQNKLQQKSPAKPEIDNDRGALDDQDLARVTGGDKASPQEFPKET